MNELLDGMTRAELREKIDELTNENSELVRGCNFWEKSCKESDERYETKLKELEEAHAIIGRLTHQLSKRWDTAPITKYMKGAL